MLSIVNCFLSTVATFVCGGSHELLRMVLEARADPDARDSFGQTPLMMAAKQVGGYQSNNTKL